MEFFNTYDPQQANENFDSLFSQSKVLHVLSYGKEVNIDQQYKTLANQSGIPIIYEEDPLTGEIRANQWTKIEYIKGEETSTYKHSNKSQPLHTDYGYFSFEIFCSFFYCVSQADFGGATTFIDADTIVDIVKKTDISLYDQLCTTKIHFGRKNNPIAHFDDYILQEDNQGWKINWNYYRALGDTKNQELIQKFKSFLFDYIEKSGELKELKLQPGEGVFFKDRRVLHGRNSFLGIRQLNKGGIATSLPKEILALMTV